MDQEYQFPDDPIGDRARQSFGVGYLYPYQRLVVANTLDAFDGPSRRQIVVLPTGSGKTLCFSLPAVMIRGVTVVVYPLLSLMADQRRRAEAAGIATDVLHGGQDRAERRAIRERLASGATTLLLTNPEMLAQASVVDSLKGARVMHLVIDEAHCVSEWGETFRPSYLALGDAISEIAPRVVTAFTATASPTVLEAVRTHLFGSLDVELVQGNPDRPNIDLSVLEVTSRDHALRALLRGDDGPILKPALVFCRSRAQTEETARTLLPELGVGRVGAYHAGLSRQERALVEAWFFESRDGVLCATCAYGMGVDKGNIRTVIHYDPAPSVEAFLQESGRAGRDGQPAVSIVLAGAEAGACREADAVRQERYRVMMDYSDAPGCRRDYLMRALGTRSEACRACDRCRGGQHPLSLLLVAVEEAECLAAQSICRLVRRRPRTYTAGTLAEEQVHGGAVPFLEHERAQVVAELMARGRLRLHRRGPWKSRLSIARRRSDGRPQGTRAP